jgi:hypothetical protein
MWPPRCVAIPDRGRPKPGRSTGMAVRLTWLFGPHGCSVRMAVRPAWLFGPHGCSARADASGLFLVAYSGTCLDASAGDTGQKAPMRGGAYGRRCSVGGSGAKAAKYGGFCSRASIAGRRAGGQASQKSHEAQRNLWCRLGGRDACRARSGRSGRRAAISRQDPTGRKSLQNGHCCRDSQDCALWTPDIRSPQRAAKDRGEVRCRKTLRQMLPRRVLRPGRTQSFPRRPSPRLWSENRQIWRFLLQSLA